MSRGAPSLAILVVVLGSGCNPGAGSHGATLGDVDAELASRLDERLDELYQETGPLALSVVVRVGDRTWFAARGLTDLDGTDVTICDRFRIYSVTKTYTAVLALLLVEDGMLDLDESVAAWYPTLPGSGAILVRHLLTHTSGLFDYLGDPEVASTADSEWDHDALIAEAAGHPLAFAPGSAYQYSNTNYVVLGRIIERITGSSYAAELRARILDPLSLDSTFLEGDEPVPTPIVEGSRLDPTGHLEPADFVHPSLAWSAGALVAPAIDVDRFAAQLFGGAILHEETLAEMMTPPVLSSGQPPFYGFGLARTATALGPYYGHAGGGACCDFSSWFGTLPDAAATVTVLASTGNIDQITIANELLRAALED